MKQTLMVKLVPTNEQCEALLETQETFNAACNYVSNVAFNNKLNNTQIYKIQEGKYILRLNPLLRLNRLLTNLYRQAILVSG